MNSSRNTALITGASSGIGFEFAGLFARDAHDLVLVARSEGKLRELASQLEAQFGIAATVIAVDLSKPDAAQEILVTLQVHEIEIDALVNNAGFGLAGPFVETDLQRELEMIQVNIVALTALTKLFLPRMVSRRSGRILNVASTAAFQPGTAHGRVLRDEGVRALVLRGDRRRAARQRRHRHRALPRSHQSGFAAVADMESARLFNMTTPMSSAEVARIGYEAMKRGKRVVIPGLLNKLVAQSIRVTPRRMVTTIARKLQEKA